MARMGFEDRVTGLELDVQSIKILLGTVDNKIERARLDVQQAQGANTRMIQALRDDMSEFRGAVEARFTAVEDRFDAVEDRFIAVDSRFDRVESRLDGMDSRFDKMDARLDEVIGLIKEMAGGPAGAAAD